MKYLHAKQKLSLIFLAKFKQLQGLLREILTGRKWGIYI